MISLLWRGGWGGERNLEVNRKTNTPSHTLGLPPEDVLVVVRRMSDPACNFNMIYDFLTLSAGNPLPKGRG